MISNAIRALVSGIGSSLLEIPPSVVPPSPGRRDVITPEARISHSRLQRAMHSWEERSKDAMIGENPFGGGQVDLEDFANLEGLVVDVGNLEGVEPPPEEN